MSKLIEKQKVDLQESRSFNLCIVGLLSELSVEDSPFFIQATAKIESTYTEQDLRGMRMLEKDYIEWAKRLPPMKRRELDDILKKQFSRGLDGAMV